MVYFEKTRADLITKEEHFESLQQVNRELNNFCHSVAHDLKGPLLSINQLAGFLIRDYADKLDSNGNKLTRYIQNKSAELIKITDYLLELARMSQKQMQMEAIQLEPLFREVYEELMRLQPERQVEFKLKQLPAIHGDLVMIKLLVRNILSNALKFTRDREPAIIEAAMEEAGNNYIISVKDNGAGFDMKDSARLFGIFERLHTNEEFEGHGVGLAICQKILQRHHGKAWLTGQVDKGATFSFSFPKDLSTQPAWSSLVVPDTVSSVS
ncbi:MAG TPA: ATP-binding protein [Methylomusa anaerophila]|nr:ATP-binding protein [Methylomusa anaerophila]HML87469.1 ATP-binding protein [Methylomusa anaerophila]